MPATYPITWDDLGKKYFESGNKKGVLYVMDASGNYQAGVPWNGLTAVSQSNSGADETALWADDIKYASLRSAEEFGATIEAYQSPKEFDICDGSADLCTGVTIGQQGRRNFGFSYVTTVGNDVMGFDYGYKIHLIYNASANPSERSYQTINDSPDAITLSWEITTTPIAVKGHKPTAHLIIDSATTDPEALADLEEILYGKDSEPPALPSPAEVYKIVTGEDL